MAWTLLGVLLIYIIVGARWVWLFRHGQPFSVDESNYLTMSLADYWNSKGAGISGFIAAFEAPRAYSPLTPALAALLYYVTGPHVIAAFAIPLLSGVGTIVATYFLGAMLGSRSIGLISAALVASCPIIVTYSRSFQFAIPATLVSSMALLALLRSERCSRIGWSTVFGACIGLMLLTRAMTIAFIPSLLLGVVLYTLNEPSNRRRRLFLMSWSFSVAVIVAATWLVPNGRYVFGYLWSYGYGGHAAQWGPENPIFSLADLIYMVQSEIAYLHLPHFIVLLAGLLAIFFTTGRHLVRNGALATLRAAGHSRLLPIVVYVGGALVALASTHNKGEGFLAPVVPAAIVLAAWSCHRICEARSYRWTCATLAVCISIVATIPTIDLRWPGARPQEITLPVLGPSVVTDGRGYIQINEEAGGAASADPAEPLSKEAGKAWVDFNIRATELILQTAGPTAWGFRHYFFDAGTVILYEMVIARRMSLLTEVDPVATSNMIEGNITWLTTGAAKDACFLVTTDDQKAQPEPSIDTEKMVTAAERVNFRRLAQLTMPNGHYASYWNRENIPGCQHTSEVFLTAITQEPNGAHPLLQ